MALPDKVSLLQVSPTMVQVSGWASEPFVLVESSARRSLDRVRSRRSTYASPDEYERHLSVYVEAFRLMDWAVPEDKAAPLPQPAPLPESPPTAAPVVPTPPAPPVVPTPPQAAGNEQPGPQEPSNSVIPEPQATPQMEFDFSKPQEETFPIQDEQKTWVKQMLEDLQSAPAGAINN